MAGIVPDAITSYVRLDDAAAKAALVLVMERFEQRFHNDLHGKCKHLYVYDSAPEDVGTDVPGLFDMLETILANARSV